MVVDRRKGTERILGITNRKLDEAGDSEKLSAFAQNPGERVEKKNRYQSNAPGGVKSRKRNATERKQQVTSRSDD
ncbi:hypothetical protein TNCV_4816571 [Trichonephila clavipes]|nr:hypothetical protein TNCV_4816571 [Trichonephila clavipes]